MNPGMAQYQPVNRQSAAVAIIRGGPLAPGISGFVYFFDVPGGSEVYAAIEGLPPYQAARDGKQPVGPHGFHIHEHGNCSEGDRQEPFMAAGGHWNPTGEPHGNHINRGSYNLEDL